MLVLRGEPRTMITKEKGMVVSAPRRTIHCLANSLHAFSKTSGSGKSLPCPGEGAHCSSLGCNPGR